jgi:peptidoglycan/xylan/chitin deacetylase (PgdA/CDA1 family)
VLKLVISCGFLAGLACARWLRRSLGRELPGTCVILYYHAVAAEERRRFARQMDTALRHAQPVRADFQLPLPPGSRCVSITFDDGLLSFVDHALPELRARRIPATLFVVAGRLGQRPDWAGSADEPYGEERLLSSAQVREIADDVLIGSHSVSHPRLTELNANEARRELAESRAALEEMLGREIATFSFPYGAFGPHLIDGCREAGYRRVFTTLPLVSPSDAEGFVMGRVSAEPSDWPLEFYVKLLGGYQWLPWAFGAKRRLRGLRQAAR